MATESPHQMMLRTDPKYAAWYGQHAAEYGFAAQEAGRPMRAYASEMLKTNLGNPNPAAPGYVTPATVPPAPPPTPNIGGPIVDAPTGTPDPGGSGGADNSLKSFQMGLGGGSTTTSTKANGSGGMNSYVRSVTSTGGGNNQALIQQLIQSLTQSSADANKAGMAQYTNLMNSIKGGTKAIMGKGGLYSKAGSQIENFGASQRGEIEDTRLAQRGELTQDLIGKGLGNTTILGNQLGGADTRATKANISLGDTIAMMKSGLLERKAGMKLDLTRLLGDTILSKQNVGPDLGVFLNLLQSLGGTGGGSGASLTR